MALLRVGTVAGGQTIDLDGVQIAGRTGDFDGLLWVCFGSGGSTLDDEESGDGKAQSVCVG